jgi:acetylglutamate kinase
LSPEGGLLDHSGTLVRAINLPEDHDRMVADLDPSGSAQLGRISQLLDELPPSASVSITAPSLLARELFTHRGAGTLVRRGERVHCVDHFDKIDQARLRHLLETCFGRALAPTYFENKACYRVYVSDDYRATAILTHEGQAEGVTVPYLDKFAVTRQAQGEGLGGSVWARLRRDNPQLFWRAQSHNDVNGWYFQQADGSYRSGGWTVFWYGMSDFDAIRRCIEVALALPATLKAHAIGDSGHA